VPQLEFNSIRLNYEVHGQGPHFFLQHGFSASTEMWVDHTGWLSRKYQLILMDARGHGLSSAPAGYEHYSWEIMAEDVSHVFNHLNIDRAIMGGLSMGGGIALAFALAYPEKVEALILSDCAGLGVHSDEMQRWQDRIDTEYPERERIVREQGITGWAYYALENGLVLPQIA